MEPEISLPDDGFKRINKVSRRRKTGIRSSNSFNFYRQREVVSLRVKQEPPVRAQNELVGSYVTRAAVKKTSADFEANRG